MFNIKSNSSESRIKNKITLAYNRGFIILLSYDIFLKI